MNYDNCDGMTYTIKQGDTLYGISRKYDVPLAMILHANPYADVYRLNIGDTICIPVKNKKKCCDDKNSSSMNDKADRIENFRENQNVRVSENTGENSEMSFMEDMADNMKKYGGFIPGIRPGKPTSDYLTKMLNYIIFIGAVGLIIVAVIPFFFNGVFGAHVSFGGTSIIIVVGVVLETLKQIESQLLVRNYKGFLNS